MFKLRARCDARILLLSLCLATTACGAGGTAGSSPVPQVAPARGHLLIVGGGPIPREITQRFVDLAGGRGNARIAVFPTASAVATTGPDKVAELRALGADAFVVAPTRATADADSIVRRLDSVTGIWFVGGVQDRITTAIKDTRVERAVRDRFLAGAVIGGTSAGAAVMSATMITGDEKRIGGNRPPSDSSEGFITIDRDNIITTPGLGLISNAIVDQHFVRRRRHNRLISLVLEHPSVLGVGIDESTALDVRPDGSWHVIGSSVAVIYDARQSLTTRAGSTLGASGVTMHVLPSGSQFDPVTGKVVRLGTGGPRPLD
jgi:cyanophycinase